VSEGRALSYVLPLHWSEDLGRCELACYLRRLADSCDEVIVVDGSPPEVYADNAGAWGTHVTHLPPEPSTDLSGKVAGVKTGVSAARNERVVIADDDVRYRPEELARAATLLESHDLVRPQNYFTPLPWHARWDTARTLINRALGGDYPGTLCVRRSTFLAMGGYDGNVLFENLELIRTVEAAGGRIATPLDLYVRRLPPSAAHFWSQRTRQAYDDFAIPPRMICWLALAPSLITAGLRRQRGPFAGVAIGAMALAEIGRRRCAGRDVFPASSSLLAPAWVLERAVCAWLAVLQRARFGGVRYRNRVIPTAAHSRRALRRRLSMSART
jgi:hypothetical protein